MADDKLIFKGSTSLLKDIGKSLRVGSLTDLVRVRQNENILLLLDCSGSMGSSMRNGKQRIEGLRETVRDIQSEKELRMVQFGSGFEPSFVTAVPNPAGGTPLHTAIDFSRTSGAGRLIVISDGCPDSEAFALEAATRFGGRIDVVFVGDPGERGEIFLKRLAESTGGESFTGDLSLPKELAGAVLGLLTDGSDDDEDEDDDE